MAGEVDRSVSIKIYGRDAKDFIEDIKGNKYKKIP